MNPSVYSFSDSVEFLRSTYEKRRELNQRFSLRAWAKQLGLTHPATLSSILRKKQTLDADLAKRIIQNLGMSPEEGEHFNLLVMFSKADSSSERLVLGKLLSEVKSKGQFTTVALDILRVIADWKKFLLLELFSSKKYSQNMKSIKTRFGVTINHREIDDATQLFLRLGLVKTCAEGGVERTDKTIASMGDVPDKDLRALQREFFGLAIMALDKCPIQEREISTNLVITKKEKIFEAKQRIQKFRRELSNFLECDDGDTVFALNTALYELVEDIQCRPLKH